MSNQPNNITSKERAVLIDNKHVFDKIADKRAEQLKDEALGEIVKGNMEKARILTALVVEYESFWKSEIERITEEKKVDENKVMRDI